MNRYDILKRFPNASEAFISANLSPDVALQNPKQCERPKALERSDEGETQGTGLRHCRFTLRRKKLLDVDAKYASVKDLLDCLTISGVIRGDKEGQISLEVNQFKTAKGEPETTTIEVFDVFP